MRGHGRTDVPLIVIPAETNSLLCDTHLSKIYLLSTCCVSDTLVGAGI